MMPDPVAKITVATVGAVVDIADIVIGDIAVNVAAADGKQRPYNLI